MFAFCDEEDASFSTTASSLERPAELDAGCAAFLVDDAGVVESRLATEELLTFGEAAH